MDMNKLIFGNSYSLSSVKKKQIEEIEIITRSHETLNTPFTGSVLYYMNKSKYYNYIHVLCIKNLFLQLYK